MQKTNLLYVITKLELGGAQKHLLGLIRGLDQSRYSIFLVTARDGILVEEARSLPGVTLTLSRFVDRPVHPLKDAAAFIELYRFIRKHSIAIVHTHSSKAGIIARWAAYLAGIRRIVHTVHGWSFNDYQPAFQRAIAVLLERLTARVTTRIIVVSEYDRNTGLSHRIGTPAQYELVRYGIRYDEFRSSATGVRQALGIQSDAPVVTMVACLKPQKAPEDLVAVAALVASEVPGVQFLLAGDGELRSRIEGLIRKAGIGQTLRLLGWRRDIPQLLAASDVVVLTSLWEGFPIVILESAASMRAVAATHTGGIAEFIRDGETGFLVQRGDVRTMAARVTALLRNAPLRTACAQKAYRLLDRTYSKARELAETQRLYNAL